MAERGPSIILLAVLVALLVVAGAVGIYLVRDVLIPKPHGAGLTVQLGDNVTVNYIGSFGSGPQLGRTFDTSIYSVYLNNVTFPKSAMFGFTHSANQSNYAPLAVHIAGSGQYTVGNLTFGNTVPGFWQGMIGLAANTTRFIHVLPSLGYGPINPACTATLPLGFSIPSVVSYTLSQFSSQFAGVTATSGSEFTDPTYHLTDLVVSANATGVTIERLASIGQTSAYQGWNITVTGINATNVSVVNDITPGNFGHLVGTFPSQRACPGAGGASHYLIGSVNLGNDTYTINWNSEVTGQTLIFQVSVVDIYP